MDLGSDKSANITYHIYWNAMGPSWFLLLPRDLNSSIPVYCGTVYCQPEDCSVIPAKFLCSR